MPQQAGLPNPNSVVLEIPFTPRTRAVAAGPAAVPGAPKYTILRTTEVDPKDAPVPPSAVAAPAAAPVSDSFAGTARKASKLSIADAPVKKVGDLRDLIGTLPAHKGTLPPHKDMKKKKIPTDSKSRRVPEEKRNVRLDVFLYAASREDDNDFHLILGRSPKATGEEVYMTMELSGLPPSTNASHPALKAARTAFKKFFGDKLPGSTYDFYKPPIPVRIQGSLFWDASHSTGSRPGPKSLRDKIPTVWEVHPITKITFEP